MIKRLRSEMPRRIGYFRATHRPNLLPGHGPIPTVELPKHQLKPVNRELNAIL